MNTQARGLVMQHEGLRLFAYVDTVGKITIGFGRNLTDRGITTDDAHHWLDQDLATSEHEVANTFPWFATLDVIRQAVLIDIHYNVGLTRLLGFTKLLAALAIPDYEQAAKEILDSQLAWKRRAHLAALMQQGTEKTQ